MPIFQQDLRRNLTRRESADGHDQADDQVEDANTNEDEDEDEDGNVNGNDNGDANSVSEMSPPQSAGTWSASSPAITITKAIRGEHKDRAV
ncbi:hypothetical protein CIB48_g7453 [Xylaria polymorpha]|nr:hypothetical protein CIB48_g7453 [Xylaria polymorpha]